MIIFIHGDDTFRSLGRLNILKQGFSKKYDAHGVNVVQLDGQSAGIDNIRKSILSAGLLEKKRCIIIKNILKNKGKALKKELVDILANKKSLQDSIIIFWEDKQVDPRMSGQGRLTKEDKELIRFLKQQKEEKFDSLSPVNLKKWVSQEFKKRNAPIDPKALDLLTGSVGSDLWKMNQEVEKLAHFKDGQVIAREDVLLFVKAKFDGNVFLLTDALGQKDEKQALRLFHEQMALGTDPLALLARFLWLIRNLVMIASLLDQFPPARIAQELGLHPYVVKKSLPQARRFTPDELKGIYGKLIEMDKNLKSSQKDPKVMFDLFIIEACQSKVTA